MRIIFSDENFKPFGIPLVNVPLLYNNESKHIVPVTRFMLHKISMLGSGKLNTVKTIGYSLYDYYSFLEIHDLEWDDNDPSAMYSKPVLYRNYCINSRDLEVSTIKLRLSNIREFYSYSHEIGYISSMPIDLLKISRFLQVADRAYANRNPDKIVAKARKIEKSLTKDEAAILLHSIDSIHHLIIVKLILKLGLRREEVASFPYQYILSAYQEMNSSKYKNVSLYAISIRLDPFDGTGMKTKCSKARNVFISTDFVKELHHYFIYNRGKRKECHSNSLVLNAEGKKYSLNGIYKTIRTLGLKANMMICPHKLRHTYSTLTLEMLIVEIGVKDALLYIQKQLGHSSLDTTMTYQTRLFEIAQIAIKSYRDSVLG